MNHKSRQHIPAFETTSLTNKFKSLWLAGIEAKLVFETRAGQAWRTLQVFLGEHPLQLQPPPHPQEHRCGRNSPAKMRRRERREAARAEAAAEEATEAVNQNSDYDHVHIAAEEVENPAESAAKADNVSEGQEGAAAEQAVKSAPEDKQVDDQFPCHICDFRSNWANGLTIHMTRKHSKIEQLDGCISVSEDLEEDEKYYGTRDYWKEGRIGTAYQTFLDAIDIVDESDLAEETKEVEKIKVFDARKCALGTNFNCFSHWI
jgi:hypothetical protein